MELLDGHDGLRNQNIKEDVNQSRQEPVKPQKIP